MRTRSCVTTAPFTPVTPAQPVPGDAAGTGMPGSCCSSSAGIWEAMRSREKKALDKQNFLPHHPLPKPRLAARSPQGQ